MCDLSHNEEERAHRPKGPVAFVDELVVALTNGRIYSRKHPRMRASLDSLHLGLQDMLDQTSGKSVRLGAAQGFLFYDQRPLRGVSLSSQRLLEPLSGLESGGVSFDPATSVEELDVFVRFLGREVKKVANFGEANRALAEGGCASIRFLPPYSESSNSWSEEVDAQLNAGQEGALYEPGAGRLQGIVEDFDLSLPVRLYKDLVGVLQDSVVSACEGNNVDTSSAMAQVELILRQLREDARSLLRIGRYEKYDAFTFGHSIRVAFLALNFARSLTSDARVQERIGLAALLHDIGKARVPFEIVHSSGRLDEAQFAEMQMHTQHGAQILLESGNADPLAVAVAFSHHQTASGGGYPDAVRAPHHSPGTMIVKIADVYEALTASRPYKPRMSPVRAYRIMLNMKGHFDPALLRRFIEVNGIYPVGTSVLLNSEEPACVHEQTDDPLRPIVMTEPEAVGGISFRDDGELLDLRKTYGKNRFSIASVVLDNAA